MQYKLRKVFKALPMPFCLCVWEKQVEEKKVAELTLVF